MGPESEQIRGPHRRKIINYILWLMAWEVMMLPFGPSISLLLFFQAVHAEEPLLAFAHILDLIKTR